MGQASSASAAGQFVTLRGQDSPPPHVNATFGDAAQAPQQEWKSLLM